ncbi:MAG: hypothetical protein DWP95_09135 [Proteobacteria bacterium]|nr:MAG: hypothetical protein DWP95_09135 [Pseudomonadota bacterium]
MKLALLTASEWPQGDGDDGFLLAALKQRGIEANWHIWQAPELLMQYDMCLIRSVWDYHLKPQAFLQSIQELAVHTPVLNAPEVVAWNSEKTYLKELQTAGLPVATTHWITQSTDGDSLRNKLSQSTDKECFLKPVIGADASATLRFKADSEGIQKALHHIEQNLSHCELMLQAFMPSVMSYGELSVIYFGRQFSHAVIKKPQAGDYRVQDTFGGVDKLYHLNREQRRVADDCMDYLQGRFGRLTYVRLDFLYDHDDQMVVNEVELIEPSLFFRHRPEAAFLLADELLSST